MSLGVLENLHCHQDNDPKHIPQAMQGLWNKSNV